MPRKKPDPIEAMETALDEAATDVEHLEGELGKARRHRHRLIHQADRLTLAGVRAFSRYRIAKMARVKPQAVDQILAKPEPPEEEQ